MYHLLACKSLMCMQLHETDNHHFYFNRIVRYFKYLLHNLTVDVCINIFLMTNPLLVNYRARFQQHTFRQDHPQSKIIILLLYLSRTFRSPIQQLQLLVRCEGLTLSLHQLLELVKRRSKFNFCQVRINQYSFLI
jgi:hypothetical protein